ncbi:hypothetical protein BGW39_005323 [Mortierella sp. 14UC]|nr:hypothetical protein BGW39_005323 [Mortierella sp. 14UC]
METGGFHGQSFFAGSDLDDSSFHESSSTTTTNTITPNSSARRYSVAGVIRSLFHAVLVQDTEHLDHVLVSLSLDPNKIRDKEHKTMLMVAATENKHRVLRYLLALPSIDVDLQDDEGETALYQAAAAGSTECAQLLLLANASASLGNEEAITPLIIASYNGFLTICRLLVSIGHANVNQQDNTQKSALLLASYAGHVDVMALLIEQGASLNILDQYGWSSLMLAAYAGKLDACKLLLAQGADPHIRTANGKNARSLSWDAGHKSIAVYITRHLSRDGSTGGGSSSVITTASGPGSSMSTRTLIQQMLPPAPLSPSRRTHSPAPSLPSVPEEAQEDDHYRPRRSFSGYNSTISRHSGLSSRLSAPPKARRHQSLPAPLQSTPQLVGTTPPTPAPLATVGQDLSAIFIAPEDTLPDSVLVTSPGDEGATTSILGKNANEQTPVEPATNGPVMPRKSQPRIPWRSATPARIYSVHRRGIIPRYGTKHIHYYSESSIENTDPILQRSGSNYHQRRVRLGRKSRNSLAERAREKDMESDINWRIRQHMLLIERNRNHAWVILSNLWTACCPAKVLPKSWSMDRQQDWREKVTFCSLLTGLTLLFGFLAFGLALLTCRPHSVQVLSTAEFAVQYGNESTNPRGLMTIRGTVYDIGSLFEEGLHPKAMVGGTPEAGVNSYLSVHYGRDVSLLFPPPGLSDTCQLWGSSTNFGKCSANSTAINHCHSFLPTSNDLLRQFERSNIVITYPWPRILDSTSRKLFVYDGAVFDATDYLAQVPDATATEAEISQLNWIRSFIGRDATLAVRKQAKYRDVARCFEAYFKVGVVSGEQDGGCLTSIVINTFSLALLLLITIMRLASALAYHVVFSQPIRTESGKGSSDLIPDNGNKGNSQNNSSGSTDSIDNESHVLMLVTCHATDQDDQIRSTLASLALTDHDDDRKLLLVMADATWDDDGERSQASLACLQLMQPPMPNSEKPPLSSMSDDSFLEDIYSGYYVVESRRIPYILVLRAPDQDSVQEEYASWWKKKLILRWLYRVCFNEPISSFEYALFERVRGLMGGQGRGAGPDVFDMLLVADIGIECDTCSLSRMVGTLRRNEKVMGVCAQRIISNGTESWLTRVQDYENHLSLQFTSAFESTLSVVQCLPSCFSLVRIKLRRHQGSYSRSQGKHDQRNSDDTSIPSDTDDDAEKLAAVKGEERGGSNEVDDADADANVNADNGTGDNQGSTMRIKRQRTLKNSLASDNTSYSIPILIHPDVISSYVGNKGRTLHERSVLLRGAEDRYLTGLLHQAFPDGRIVYVPQAISRSTATSCLRSFLQEQALLLSSSFHTLWRQIWISELRGRFCCSLNFLVILEWLALVILPSAVVFSVAFLVVVAVGAAKDIGALDALPVVLALCFMMAVVVLQPLLGICLGGRQRSFARNLFGAALFLVVMPFKSHWGVVCREWQRDTEKVGAKASTLGRVAYHAPFRQDPPEPEPESEPKSQSESESKPESSPAHEEKWTEVFEDSNLSLDSLKARALSQHSNLGIDGIRSVCWKVYLGCIPTLEISTWPFAMTTERERYVELRQKYIRAIGSDDGPEPDLELNNPLSLAEDSPWQQFFVDSELKKIIKQDVERTFPDNDYFRSEKVQDQLNDILFIYCKINHDVSYRQGMHELLAHILWVVSSESLDTQSITGASSDATLDVMRSVLDAKFIEHDTFALFSSLMSRAKPWYEFSDEGFASKRPRPANNSHNAQPFGKSDTPEPAPGKQTPVIEWSMKIFQYLERVDNELYLHLKGLEIQPQLFGMLLFGREFPMEDVLDLWDGIFAKDPSLNICIFIGLALLLRIRDELLEEDFAGCLHKLMRYPSVKDVQQFIPQALRLQNMPNAAGGQEVIRQNYVLAGKPLPPLPTAVEADHGGQHHQQQQQPQNPYQQQQQHHQQQQRKDGSASPIPQRRQQQGGHHQDHHKIQSGSFPGNGVLSQHLPPAALDAIKPVAEGFVHVTKNVLESKGGAAINKAIHDMKKNTQSYIRKANAPATASSTQDFPPMFEQVVSSVSRQSAATRHASPTQQPKQQQQQSYQDSHATAGGSNTDKQLQSQLGQIVAKALVILESEFVSPSSLSLSTGGSKDLSANNTLSKESPDAGSVKSSPSKAALAAIFGLEHVRDILLGFTKDLDPLVIESGMLDKSAAVVPSAPKATNSSSRTTTPTQAATPPVERTPINATRQDTLQSNTRNSNSPSRSMSDHSIERQGLSRNSSQASDLSRFSNSGDHHQQEYHFNVAGSGSTPPPAATTGGADVVPALMAETYLPAPVPPPPTPKPFSFDDLLGDSTTVSTSSRTSSPPSSRKTGTGLAGSGLASKIKSPRSSLANSQFSWMLNDSGDDGGSVTKASGGASGGGGGAAGGGGGTRSSMDLFSPGSTGRMKIDPLAGSVSRGSGVLGGGGSGGSTSAGAGSGGHQALQDDDPLRT